VTLRDSAMGMSIMLVVEMAHCAHCAATGKSEAFLMWGVGEFYCTSKTESARREIDRIRF
jgi:hypothetical protein